MHEGRASVTLKPFRAAVPDEVLADLDARLAATRWPTDSVGRPWQWGTDKHFMQQLVEHWRTAFDWRAWEARLNSHEQYMASVSGVDVHVLVERGSGTNPLPIILTHGWPGSVFELIELVAPLAHPERFGGAVEDAFTVILPSLPGFGFSPAPDRVLSPQDVAALWHELMTEGLGFQRYVAHGGDTGATVASWMGFDRHECLPAIHVNTPVLHPQWSLVERPLSEEEMAFAARQHQRSAGEDAYQHIHAEKPATLAFGLCDSPVGLAAWMVEKFHGWTDKDSGDLTAISKDHMIATIMSYWLFTLDPTHWMYQSLRDLSGYLLPTGRRVDTPTGFCLFPNDIVVPPPGSWLDRGYNVARVTRASSGGHFPGIENSAFLTDDIRTFFRAFR